MFYVYLFFANFRLFIFFHFIIFAPSEMVYKLFDMNMPTINSFLLAPFMTQVLT